MKLTKIFGIVLGLHIFVIGLLFILPGCNSTPQNSTTASETEASLSEPTYSKPTADSPAGSSLHPDFNAGLDERERVSYPPTRPTRNLIETSGDVLEPLEKAKEIPMTDYTVKRGDSLWTIAKSHGVSLDALLEANDFDRKTTIYAGQKIVILPTVGSSPGVPAPVPLAPVPREDGTPYTVKVGDTLSDIASRFGTTVSAIKAANGLSTDLIRAGQTLSIPDSSGGLSPSPSAPSPVTGVEENLHVVSKGETPSSIAHKYGMRTEELMRINNITDPRKLRVGQTLIVKTGGTEAVGLPSSVKKSLEASESSSASKATAPEIEPIDKSPSSIEALERSLLGEEGNIPVIPIDAEKDEAERQDQLIE